MEQPISELEGALAPVDGVDAGTSATAAEPAAELSGEQPATSWEAPPAGDAVEPAGISGEAGAGTAETQPQEAAAPWAEPVEEATPADDALQAKDEEIARLQGQLAERDSIAGALSARVAQQEESINGFQAQLVAKDGQIRELTDRAADISGQFQRLSADFDNFRRRASQERENLVKFAGEGVLTDLLPIFDNFGRAMQAANAIDTDLVIKGLEAMINQIKGLDMIRRQLDALMQKKGVAIIPTVGETFDPNLHEAVMMEETSEHPDQAIIGELQSGYTLSGKVLRPAMVKVASNPAGVAPPPAAAPEPGDAVEPAGISGEAGVGMATPVAAPGDAAGPAGISGEAGAGTAAASEPVAEPAAGSWDQISEDLGTVDLKVENVPGEES